MPDALLMPSLFFFFFFAADICFLLFSTPLRFRCRLRSDTLRYARHAVDIIAAT